MLNITVAAADRAAWPAVGAGWLVLALLAPVSASMASDWLEWGGPTRDFKTESKGLAEEWPEFGPKRLWQRPLGEGYAAILAKGDRLFTLYRAGDEEVVVCLDAPTGKTVWEHKAPSGPFWPDMAKQFGLGPNATPVIVEDRILAVGITGRMRCLELATGKLLWTKDLPAEFGRRQRKEEYGYSNSLVRYGDRVVVLVGGDKHAVVALRPQDGSVAWASDPYDGVSYAAPAVVSTAGLDQVVFFTPTQVVGIDAKSGRHHWQHPCKNLYENNCTAAVPCPDDHLWVATQMEGATRVLKLAKEGDRVKATEVWKNPKVKVFHWNMVQVGDHIYGSFGGSSVSLLGAVNWRTGEFAWQQRGLHVANCVYADGKLVLLDSNGQLALAKVSPQGIDILQSAQVTDRVSWTVPTLVGTTLYVRDRKHILALDLAATK